MKKDDILKIAAVLIVVGFLTESFWFGGGLNNLLKPQLPPGTNITGTTTFNGTIRTYDPFLFIPGNVSQSIIDKLNTKKEVRGIQLATDGIIINLDSRDSVYPVAVYLRDLGVAPLARANVVVDRDVEVETLTGKIKTPIPNGVVQLICEPLIDADTQVPVSLVVILVNDQIISYQSAKLLVDTASITLDGKINSLNQKTYTYLIPWEERNSLGNLSSFGNVNYKKIDTIIFAEPLQIQQIMVKRSVPFVIYIDANSAQLESSFDNLNRLNLEFNDTKFTLPSSKLTIITTDTPDLVFNSTVVYSYNVTVTGTSNYILTQNLFTVDSSTAYQPEDEVKVSMDVSSLCGKIIAIKRVSLPS